MVPPPLVIPVTPSSPLAVLDVAVTPRDTLAECSSSSEAELSQLLDLLLDLDQLLDLEGVVEGLLEFSSSSSES